MIKYKNRIVERQSHGRSITTLIKTLGSVSQPPVITCFGSFKSNMRPIFTTEPQYNSDGMPIPSDAQGIYYFTYSRNDGPIQRVVLDPNNVEDWVAYDALVAKLDTDLCRAKDGESLSFSLQLSEAGTYNQLLPDINTPFDAGNSGGVIVPMSVMSISAEQELQLYNYKIMGISGDGTFPLSDTHSADAREIAIPLPLTSLLDKGEDVYLNNYPRWYPENDIQAEDNKITIYPSNYTEENAFDLFEMLGGTGETPVTVTSCVAVVPRKYTCLATSIVGSHSEFYVDAPIPTLMSIDASETDFSTLQFNPIVTGDNIVNQPAFPFAVSPISQYTPKWWPDDNNGGAEGYPKAYACTFSKNDGPRKTIVWTPETGYGSEHTVWDAIKEIILDEDGRTAFVLTGFNSREDSFAPVILSGLSSNVRFTNAGGNELTTAFSENARAVEIRDRSIRFADENAGTTWVENELTVYPTSQQDIQDLPIGELSFIDFYEYLCKDRVQLEVGAPLTVHSCAVVEPKELIQPNSKTTLDIESAITPSATGLSCSVRLNDGALKNFSFGGEELELGIFEIINYISYLGKEPIIATEAELSEVNLPNSVINKMYFKLAQGITGLEISGCSGIERHSDRIMSTIITVDNGNVAQAELVILDDNQSPVPATREVNKVTFIKSPKNGYIDFFDMISDSELSELDIYSSSGVPCIIYERSNSELPGGGDGEIDPIPDPNPEIVFNPDNFNFRLNTAERDLSSYSSMLTIILADPGDDWKLYADGLIIASRTYSTSDVTVRYTSSWKEYEIRYDNLAGTDIIFEVVGHPTFISVTQGNPIPTDEDPGIFEVFNFGAYTNQYRFEVFNIKNIIMPDSIPKVFTNLSGLFTNLSYFNQDISGWDVSNVEYMNEMFFNCTAFNQDLSGWCVSNITEEPSGFSYGTPSWIKPKPVWGTCPGNSVSIPEDAFVVELTKFKDGYYSSAMSDAGIVRMARSTLDWQLHDVSTGELLADQDNIYNSEVIYNGNHDDTTYIKLPYNKKMTLAMTGGFAGVQMFVDVAERYSNDMTVYGHVNILRYPSNISSIQHSVSGYTLTVPHELPSGMGSMDNYFIKCNLFNQDIGHWDLSGVGSVNSMFYGAKSFNQDIGDWDVSSIFSMNNMMNSAQSFNQDLSRWCVRNIPELGYQWDYDTPAWTLPKPVWGTCPGEVIIHPEPNGDTMVFTVSADDNVLWNTSFIIRLGNVGDDWQLSDESGVIASPSYSTPGVRVTSGLYDRQVKLENIANKTNRYTLTISTDFVKLQYGTTQNEGDVNITVNVEKFSNTAPSYGFILPTVNLTVPESIPASVTSFEEMFFHAKHFNQDISMWDTSNVTNMTRMFNHAHRFNQDLSNWDVSNVTTMEDMFLQARAFNGDVTTWNVGSVTNMSSMFNGAHTFNQDIGGWNVVNVINMDGMFFDAQKFDQDLSTWNVLNIPSEPSSFYYNYPVELWILPKPVWGTTGAPPVDTTLNPNFFPIDLSGQSGTQFTISKNDGPYQTYNLMDPNLDYEGMLGMLMFGQTQDTIAYLAHPGSLVDVVDTAGISGLLSVQQDGVFYPPEYPEGYTPTRIALNPDFVLNEPFYFGPQTNTITIKATEGIPPEQDLFNSFENPNNTTTVSFTSYYVMYLA